MKQLVVLVMMLAGVIALSHAEEEFKCLDGAKEPAPHKPGNILRWCEITRAGRPLYHGSVWQWHRNGQLSDKEFYVNGHAEGEWPSWYDNGKPSSLGSFRNGSKTGLWKYWDHAGWLKSEVNYAESGNALVEYYASGQKRATGKTAASGKIGEWTYWAEDGTIKATCDFQTGLFKLPSSACQLIADDLNPKGFSRPIPVVSIESERTATLRVATQVFRLESPAGWVADSQAAKKEQIPLVFFERGGSWRGTGTSLYLVVRSRNGRSFDDVLKADTEGLQRRVAEYSESNAERGVLQNGKTSIAKTIQYKSVTQKDSPFAVVSPNITYETLTFVDVSEQTTLMFVLTAHSEPQLKASTPALMSLLGSLRVEN